METLSKLFILATASAIIAATHPSIAGAQEGEVTLGPDEGYLALLIDTLDPLYAFRLKGPRRVKINHAAEGTSLFVRALPEGQYCLHRFVVFRNTYRFDDDAICFFVEAGEMNYPGHFVVRDPVTSVVFAPGDMRKTLARDHLGLCESYFGDDCEEEL